MKKLKELFMYSIAIALFAAAAYNLGLFNVFISSDTNSSTNEYSDINAEAEADLKASMRRIKSHRPAKIPEQVIQGSIASQAWIKVFTSKKKVVFCVYNDDNPVFRDALLDFVANEKLDKFYDVLLFSLSTYKRYNAGAPSTRICTSIADCKKMRDKAANYATLSDFMDNCSKTVCIFNPEKKQYIMLKKRKFSELKQLMIDIRAW